MPEFNYDDIKLNLKSEDENLLINTLHQILELKKQNIKILDFYKELSPLLYHKTQNIRWLIAEIYDTPKNLLELKNSTNEQKIREIKFLADITVPNMVQDRSERNIEYAMPFLTIMLFDDDENVCYEALETIHSAQSDDQDFEITLAAMLKFISGRNDKLCLKSLFIIRNAVMSPFKMMEISVFLPLIEKCLHHENEKIKWVAADILSFYFAKSQKWEKVIDLLKNNDKDIRQEAAGTLTRIYSKITPAIKTLNNLLSDEYEDVRIVAARTLVYKADKIQDVLKSIPIILASLKNEKEENRIYASEIVYDMINLFLKKQKKSTEANKKHWFPIENINAELENHLIDTSRKVAENISKSLAKYYLCNNLTEKVLGLFEKSDTQLCDLLIKNTEPDEIHKPAEVLDFIKIHQKNKLIQKFEKDAKMQIKELRLSAEDFNTIKLIELPVEVCNITSLEKLNISQNKLTTFPEEIGNLVNLENLTATSNKLKTLPRTIENLQKLKYLYLYRNQLKTLPKEIGKCKQLRMLQLTQNKINVLPAEIGNLENLTDLDLHENNLKKLPETFGNLKNLVRLDLRNNKFRTFPQNMENLQNLEMIMLDNNDLTEIPEFIFKLQKLKYLGFSFNKLNYFPVKLTDLKNLETLELRSNQITEIPAEIKKLRHLRILDLTNNQLKELPIELNSINSLGFLYIDRNPLNLKPEVMRLNKPSQIFRNLL